MTPYELAISRILLISRIILLVPRVTSIHHSIVASVKLRNSRRSYMRTPFYIIRQHNLSKTPCDSARTVYILPSSRTSGSQEEVDALAEAAVPKAATLLTVWNPLIAYIMFSGMPISSLEPIRLTIMLTCCPISHNRSV